MARLLIALAVALVLSGCGQSKFRSYDGPEVTQIQIHKERRKMYLLHERTLLKAYDIGLGFAPIGDKQTEGDGRTPEGAYWIDRRNPNSSYHLSLGISYPDPYDVAEAALLGQEPGGDIFIHGRGKLWKRSMPDDWTWGCIAVTDREMEDIYAMVGDGTRVFIFP